MVDITNAIMSALIAITITIAIPATITTTLEGMYLVTASRKGF